jgi:uncharacterized membrane protein YiaA
MVHPYFLSELKAQFVSVGPITIILTLSVIVARRRLIDDFWQTILGMICAVIGLTFFLFGLKGSVMPLAEKVGTHVNEKYALPVVLFISFVLGVLVTLAEPAVSSLRPLGREVDRIRAPYLYYMMNDGVEWLLVSIGIGVGIAAIIGTTRFVYRWPFKPIAIISTVMCLSVSGLVSLLIEDLRPMLALAWDAGAVTTGPVTVPILLALGKGAVNCSSRRQTNSNTLSRPPMQGFGLVTLASLYPIICVHIYGLIVYMTVSKESILALEPDKSDSVVDRPPVREIITAIRSITPLVLVLIIIMKLFLRMDLPSVSMQDIVQQNISQAPVDATSVVDNAIQQESSFDSSSGSDSDFPPRPDNRYANVDIIDPQAVYETDIRDEETLVVQENGEFPLGEDKKLNDTTSEHKFSTHDSLLPGTEDIIKCFDLEQQEQEEEDENWKTNTFRTAKTEKMNLSYRSEFSISPKVLASKASKLKQSYWARECIFYESLLASQIGLILFNIGLHYGFTSLGDQVGSLLPAFYSSVEGDSDSPLMPKGLGIFVSNIFIFCLGILATRAEPGLKVLAEQVKALTNSVMKRTKTVYSVALGVGIGMVAGASRLQFDLDIYPYLGVMYAVALIVTIFSREIVAKVAWDSAGVTTGPVTVPFVLSIGLSYARSRLLPSGFGILSCASVGPIISVLLAFFKWSCPTTTSNNL